MRRVLLGLMLLFVALGAVEAQRQSMTPPKAPPPDSVSIAAPADSLSEGTLYYVNGSQLVPCAVRSVAVMPNSPIELEGETGALTILETQPHFRIAESSNVPELRLGVLEVQGEKRRAQTNPKKVFKKNVPLVAQRVRDRIYDLAPEKPLAPGEYAIGWHLRYEIATFAIICADFSVRPPATPAKAP